MLLSDGKLKQDKCLLVMPKKICLLWSICEASAFLAEVERRFLMTPSTFINLLPSVYFQDHNLYSEMAHFPKTCYKNKYLKIV